MSENENSGFDKHVTILGFWATTNGHFRSMPLTEEKIVSIIQNLAVGGKLLLRKRTLASIQASKDPTKQPGAYLEFVPKEADEEFRNRPKPTNYQQESESQPESGL